MGEKGEGLSGTIIKDTWTMTRGRKQEREVERPGGERQKTVFEQQQQKMLKLKKKKTP